MEAETHMYYKNILVENSTVTESYYKLSLERDSSGSLEVALTFDKKNRTLLLYASINEGFALDTSKTNIISAVDFEEALKRATNHFLRKISTPNYLLVDKRKLEAKLKVESKGFDDIILVRY